MDCRIAFRVGIVVAGGNHQLAFAPQRGHGRCSGANRTRTENVWQKCVGCQAVGDGVLPRHRLAGAGGNVGLPSPLRRRAARLRVVRSPWPPGAGPRRRGRPFRGPADSG
jgi:hypothetical protein